MSTYLAVGFLTLPNISSMIKGALITGCDSKDSVGELKSSILFQVFALHHYKPTPLYVMDEIDAALDFRNVSIVANYIKVRT